MILGEEQPFDFEDPTEIVGLLNPAIQNGTSSLHPWQIRLMKDFAVESTAANPYKAVLRAANGSGKDRMAIAPCAIWLGMKYPSSNSIVTSASWGQLDRQTNKYIEQLALATNAKFGAKVWEITQKQYRNTVTGSIIDLFATDEPGKAEGAHPSFDDGQFGIFVSEAKSIEEDIFAALTRCTGFTKRLDVSSPGLPQGYFYEKCMNSDWIKYHITAFDCPHLPESYIKEVEQDYGVNSVLYRSMILAEFGMNNGELLIITRDKVNSLYRTLPVHIPENYNQAGLDLSFTEGGDETVLAIRNGNKIIALECFKFDDTQKSIEYLERLFNRWDLTSDQSEIFADAGGGGKVFIDQLRARGWKNVRYVLNQGRPFDARAYKNLGTELWFRLARLIQEFEIIPPEDELFKKQISNRYFSNRNSAQSLVHQIESKADARSRGASSPDRADAVALAYHNYTATYKEKTFAVSKTVERLRPVNIPFFVPTQRELARMKTENALKRFSQQGGRLALNYNKGDNSYIEQEIARFNQQIKERNLNVTN